MRSHLVFYPGRDVEKPASIGKADAVPILHHQPPSGERVPHGARHFGNVEAGKPIAALRGCAPPSSGIGQTTLSMSPIGVAESPVKARTDTPRFRLDITLKNRTFA